MTHARMRITPIALDNVPYESSEFQLLVVGHAGYSEKGNDIVCAAESILVQTLAACLTKCDENFLHTVSIEGDAGSGCVDIVAIPTKKGWEHILGMFESAAMGFCLLASTYPDNVSFKLKTPYTKEKQHATAKF